MYSYLAGSKLAKILEPSNGGKGNRLNVPNMTLYHNMIVNMLYNMGLVIISDVTINPTIIATIILENGPARETNMIPFLLFLKLLELIGTGFAQPNLNIKRNINPIRSICLKGFRDNLPDRAAVSSPSRYAI